MNWQYYWRRYLGWCPLQFCMNCGRAYWGGIPLPAWLVGYERQWQPGWNDYCSRGCADEDLKRLG